MWSVVLNIQKASKDQIPEFMSKKREQKGFMHTENVNNFENFEVLGASENEEEKNAICYPKKRKHNKNKMVVLKKSSKFHKAVIIKDHSILIFLPSQLC